MSACRRNGSRPTRASSVAPATVAPRRFTYGSDASQWADLYEPVQVRHPGVVVIVHGGYWQSDYTASLGEPLAMDLAARGYTAWNLEYRRLGNGGGWPATFEDVAAGIDRLATVTSSGSSSGSPSGSSTLDLTRVVAVGHSAGGQLAVWAGARPKLATGAPGAHPRVMLRGVIAQAGVLDLRRADQQGLGGGTVAGLMGGSSRAVPARYRVGDPLELVPLGIPVRCLHSATDGVVPIEQSAAYVAAATAVGDDARLTRVPGDHFALISPSSPAWAAALELLPTLLA